MGQQHMVQGHVAGLQRDVDAGASRHVDGDLLTAAQQVVLVERVAMLELVLEMAARPELAWRRSRPARRRRRPRR
jgi:hypothetical protein